MPIHPERRARSEALAALNPSTDWHEIYRRAVLWELPREARLGFQLAFYRPLAVPRMAKVLARSGHFQSNTTRRAYDTGIVMHEIIYGGVDSDRGQKMIRLMNALHDRPGVKQRDLTYVLNALIVIPSRFIARVGWRPLHDTETTATWRFYTELGARMRIESMPASYSSAEEDLDRYEAEHLAPSSDGAALTEATVVALADRLPRLARPYAGQIMSTLIADRRVVDAVGLPTPAPWLAAATTSALAAKRLYERSRAPAAKPSFTPGQPAGTVYPRGYDINRLGPEPHQAQR